MEERQMSQLKNPGRLRPVAKSLPQVIRHFLTPAVFRQVRRKFSLKKQPRWDIHPLIYVVLLMTWCCGDTLAEKFEIARGFYAVCCPKRRRAGKTFSGLEKALAKLPMPVLRGFAAAFRSRILELFGERLFYQGWIPLGCDGTRLECPRSEELERRLGTFGKEGSSPKIWNTSIVHLTLGIPWSWRWGLGGKSSERTHLVQMLRWLPKAALLVADAGYVGYDVLRELCRRPVTFLIRMSSNATFYTDCGEPLDELSECIAYYWPKKTQKEGKPALRGRLIRIRSRRRKVDVWLFTNVEDPQLLSKEMAARFYRWRWENEGFFRTYKRTLSKVKLACRTMRLVHREAECSMLATQLLICQGALAMPVARTDQPPVMCSSRGVLVEVRREIRHCRTRNDFRERLSKAQRERRSRTTPKEKRQWPRRKTHTPPKPPVVLRLTDELKSKIESSLSAA
jgi:hypothetical protein